MYSYFRKVCCLSHPLGTVCLRHLCFDGQSPISQLSHTQPLKILSQKRIAIAIAAKIPVSTFFLETLTFSSFLHLQHVSNSQIANEFIFIVIWHWMESNDKNNLKSWQQRISKSETRLVRLKPKHLRWCDATVLWSAAGDNSWTSVICRKRHYRTFAFFIHPQFGQKISQNIVGKFAWNLLSPDAVLNTWLSKYVFFARNDCSPPFLDAYAEVAAMCVPHGMLLPSACSVRWEKF